MKSKSFNLQIVHLLVASCLFLPPASSAQDDGGPFDESEPPFAPAIKRPALKQKQSENETSKGKKNSSKDSENDAKLAHIAELEQQLFELVNKDRASLGMGPLKLNSQLSAMAKAHAQDMMKKNFFSHTNKEGLDAQARASKMGIGRGVYENIAYQQGDILDSQKVINLEGDFMAEPEGEKNHRYNILFPGHCCVGVGVAIKGDKLILVEEFTDSEPGT